jgi:membrane protease YdiL (CAAX protease family)
MILALFGIGITISALMQNMIAVNGMNVPAGQTATGSMTAMLNPDNLFFTRLTHFLNSFLVTGLPAFLYLIVCHGRQTIWLGFSRHVNTPQILTGFLVIFFITIFAGTLKQWSMAVLEYVPVLKARAQVAEKAYGDMMVAVTYLKDPVQYAVSALLVCLLPAVFEEAFFRGTVQNLFERWWKKPIAAIVVTSFIFSLIHASYYLFLSRFTLSLALGWIFYRSKNIWVPIMAHFLNNLFALTALYISTQAGKTADVNNMGVTLPWWMGMLALAVTIGLCFLYEKISAKNRAIIVAKENAMYEKARPFNEFINTEKSKWV